jgi:hypothetical protein
VERRRRIRREYDDQVTRMDTEKLVKISRDNVAAGNLQDFLKEDGAI